MKLIGNLLKCPRIIYFCILIIVVIGIIVVNLPAPALTVTGINFIGSATFPTNYSFQGTPFGGLSGITYDAKKQLYYAISDDRSDKAPARFYTLKIDLSKGSLTDGGVSPVGVTTLFNDNGQPFQAGSIDAEGIALTSKESVFISSEGDVKKPINPFIQEFSLSSGKILTKLPVPKKFLPGKSNKQGVRNNLAFEALTIVPNKKYLYTATENALIQDGPEAQPKISSPCRILQYNLLTKQPEKEFLYQTEPVNPLFVVSRMFSSGLTDFAALDNKGHLLSLERSFTGLGLSVSLYQVSLSEADDIQDIDSVLEVNSKDIKPVKKQLLLDLKTLDVVLDNIEGLTLGEWLPDGNPSLILVSDNNFNPIQRTQILAFRLQVQQSPLIRFLRIFIPNFNP
jgi:hypothetical protein